MADSKIEIVLENMLGTKYNITIHIKIYVRLFV